MLTPLDIQNKEFAKSFRGYAEIEVDSFLDEVIADYEQIFKENLELKNKIDMLNEQIQHYGSIENTLQKTLVVAQTTAEEVILNARKQADAIMKESDRRAEKIIESARDQVINSKKEYERIRKEVLMFRAKYKSLLNSQLETIEHYGEEGNAFNIIDEMKKQDYIFDENLEEKQVEKEVHSDNLQGHEDSYSQNVQVQESSHVEDLHGQEKQNGHESLYVENLQDKQRLQESRVTPKESLYQEDIRSIYTSVEEQVDNLSRYSKKPVLD